MALSIKNPEAERLARELARERGATITQSVIVALEEALTRARGRKTAPSVQDAILEIAARCSSLPDVDSRTVEEILGYDEGGAFS